MESLDAADPLQSARNDFLIPDGLIYLNGNSLGAMPKEVPARVAKITRPMESVSRGSQIVAT